MSEAQKEQQLRRPSISSVGLGQMAQNASNLVEQARIKVETGANNMMRKASGVFGGGGSGSGSLNNVNNINNNNLGLTGTIYTHASQSAPTTSNSASGSSNSLQGGGGNELLVDSPGTFIAPPPSSSSNLNSAFNYSMRPDDYELLQVIGQGSSATVYLAQYKIPLPSPVTMTGKVMTPTTGQGQQLVSIKVIDLDMFERNQIDELRRELQIMTLSRHPNLLPVYGSFVNGTKLFIVTPFLSAGSGLDIMKTAFQNGMDEAIIATILKQVLQGLDYLHAHGLIHRDIKAGNLLVNNDGLVQLADFGVSSSLTDHGARGANRKTFVGTPCWMSPEVMDQSGYDYKADIWSFGITALELAYGHAPYAKFPPMKVLMLTLQNPPPTLDREKTVHKYSKSFKEMIDSCLQKDPTRRPSADKLLLHPFFKTAKKPAYLVTSLLNGLTPITERMHLKQNNQQQQGSNVSAGDNQNTTKSADWDFNEGPGSAKAQFNDEVDIVEAPDRPRAVKFEAPQPANILPDHQVLDDASESLSIQRSSVASNNSLQIPTPVTNANEAQGRSSVSSLGSAFGGAEGRASNTDAPHAPLSGSLPRKSRFVVDNPNLTGNAPHRTDSSSSVDNANTTNSNVASNSASITSNPSNPSVGPVTVSSPQLPHSQQVKKGRFSVIDSATSGTPPVTSSTSATTPTLAAANLSSSLVTPIAVISSSNSTSNSSGRPASPSAAPRLSETGKEDLPAAPSTADTSTSNSLERKAGRFAYQNLPSSAMTSPVLSATEGPKVPRKFTIVSETTNGPLHPGSSQSPPPPAHANSVTSIPASSDKKSSRFKLVDSILESPAYTNAIQALQIPMPTQDNIPANANTNTNRNTTELLLQALNKQNDQHRIIIQDLLSLLNRPPYMTSVPASGIAASSASAIATASPMALLPPPLIGDETPTRDTSTTTPAYSSTDPPLPETTSTDQNSNTTQHTSNN